ncbi:MAG: ATPase, T2SS/T4P/T4SS family [Planctomycetota bacterium]
MSNATFDMEEIDFQDEADLELFDPEVAARELVTYAVGVQASDVFLTDEPTSVAVKIRRMGRIEHVQRLSREAGRRLQNHFRAVSGADVTDQIKPVEGRDVIQLDDDRLIDIRISALPSVFGQDLALRLFGGDESIMRLDQLGMFAGELAIIRDLLSASSGLILVAGPTGSGKTNSLYAFLKHLRRDHRKIHTIEEPIEHLMPGIVQSAVNLRAGVDFAGLLSAILRHAPDVIMIGEIRDERTAEIAVRAGGSGQLVLASVHARTAVGAIQSMLAYNVNPNFLASSLVGIVAQRLVRRMSPETRFEIGMSDVPEYLSSIRHRMPSEAQPALWMPRPTEQYPDGYDRLTCIPEILKVGPKVRQAITDGLDSEAIEAVALADGMVPFRTAAQMRLATGVTTAEELISQLPDRD